MDPILTTDMHRDTVRDPLLVATNSNMKINLSETHQGFRISESGETNAIIRDSAVEGASSNSKSAAGDAITSQARLKDSIQPSPFEY